MLRVVWEEHLSSAKRITFQEDLFFCGGKINKGAFSAVEEYINRRGPDKVVRSLEGSVFD